MINEKVNVMRTNNTMEKFGREVEERKDGAHRREWGRRNFPKTSWLEYAWRVMRKSP